MPRRRPRFRRFERKDDPAICPFCEAKIPRPKPVPDSDGFRGGHCECGALFLFDESGKTGGQSLLAGLTLISEGDIDLAMSLRPGVDYEVKDVGYRERTHSLEPKSRRRGGDFGIPKLWFFRRLG